jgi:AcrR family transcriptional regulator
MHKRPKLEHNARERILRSAYELFSKRGLYPVSVDEIVAHSGVAKATLYRHFPSKEALELAFLERRDEQFTKGWLIAEATSRASTPEERLLAIFDVLDEWFHTEEFEGCSFVNALHELGADDEVSKASLRYLETIQAFERSLAAEAGLEDPDEFTLSFHILKRGAIVAAEGGDADAAVRAKRMASDLIDRHRLKATSRPSSG